MSNIDKQAVQAVADLKAGYTLGHTDVEIIQQMALDAVTLLDELEAMHKYAKDRDAENEGLMLTVGRLRVEKEAAEKRIADYQELISGLVDISSSILREVDRINNAAAAGKGE